VLKLRRLLAWGFQPQVRVRHSFQAHALVVHHFEHSLSESVEVLNSELGTAKLKGTISQTQLVEFSFVPNPRLPSLDGRGIWSSGSITDIVRDRLDLAVLTLGPSGDTQNPQKYTYEFKSLKAEGTGRWEVVVPEPSTYFAGALVLLPMAAQALRFVRKQLVA